MRGMESQQALILRHLSRAGSITPMEAFRLYGCTRLGGHVFFLRRKGWKITTERRKGKSGGMYAVYRLAEGQKIENN